MNRVRRVKLTSRSVVFAIAVHGLILLLLGLSIDWNSDSVPMAANKSAPVQAQAIAAADLDEELQKIKDKENEKIKKQQDRENKLKELKEQQEREKSKLAELQNEKKRKQEEAKKAEAKRVDDEQKRKQDEVKRLALEKDQKKKKEQAEKLAAEKKLKADKAKRLAEQKKKEEVARKLAKEEKRKEDEARRIAELERQQKLKRQQAERELQERLEAERMQRNERLATSTFTNQYVAAIQQKVSRNWIRPTGAQQGLTALVAVRVTPGGEVLSARIVRGSGDAVFDRSVINAVLKASPLPFPQDAKFYEFLREFKLEFRPDQLVS